MVRGHANLFLNVNMFINVGLLRREGRGKDALPADRHGHHALRSPVHRRDAEARARQVRPLRWRRRRAISRMSVHFTIGT